MKLQSPFVPLAALSIALAALVPAEAPGQTTDPQKLTPEQMKSIRDRLRSIVTGQEEITFQKNTTLTQTFLNASESSRASLSFYLDCVEIVDFEEEGYSSADFRDWKDRNKGKLSNDEFAKGLQIFLRYLAISTEAARASDIANVFPLLTQYVDGLVSLKDPPHGVLNDPIYSSVFAKRYDLFDDLRRSDREEEEDDGNDNRARPVGWESRPINIGGIYKKTVLPYLKQTSPEKVAGAWAKRIDQQGRMAILQGDAAEERFRTRGLPELQWGMFIDQFQAGYEVSAVTRMLDHLEQHKLTHPKAERWISEAIGLLFPGTDSTFISSGSEPGPEPATPPATSPPFQGVKIGE